MLVSPILHADADSFFASVVMRHRPELRTRPMAVNAHVFVASANYPARARGVRGAMLISEALARCPELVIIDVPREEVEEAGEQLHDLFGEVGVAVEPGSIEEAFVAVGAVGWDGAAEIATELRRRALAELGLPVSVGIGRTKLFAKLASRAAKPDGLCVIRDVEERRLRDELPIDEVWGIGPTTRTRLAQLDVRTLVDLDGVPDDRLRRVCGTGMMRMLRAIRLGTDDAVVRSAAQRTVLTSEAATVGYERRDATVDEMLEACVARVSRRAMKAGLVAAGVKVEFLPDGDGAVITRAARLPDPDAAFDRCLATARRLGDADELPRLRGLRVSLTGLIRAEWAPVALF